MSTRTSFKLLGGAHLHVELATEVGSTSVRDFIQNHRGLRNDKFLLACLDGELVALPFASFKARHRFAACSRRSSQTEGRQPSEVSHRSSCSTEDQQPSDVSVGSSPLVTYPNWAHINVGTSLSDLMSRTNEPGGLYIIGAVKKGVAIIHVDQILQDGRVSSVPDESGPYVRGTLEPPAHPGESPVDSVA